jgi:hypothetical protein
MPFVCPECSSAGSLRITHSLELPPDSRSDEITLQIVRCVRCGFVGIAVYEESRRGSLDDESVDHTGYHASREDVLALQKAISACPAPRNARCRCATHRRLGHRGRSGRWDGLAETRLGAPFAMKRGR